jgi:hypothetical protein
VNDLVAARKLAVTPRRSMAAASRFASERVERSEFVSSALGEERSTCDDAPVFVSTMLSFMPAAIWSAKSSPEMPSASVNCAIE